MAVQSSQVAPQKSELHKRTGSMTSAHEITTATRASVDSGSSEELL